MLSIFKRSNERDIQENERAPRMRTDGKSGKEEGECVSSVSRTASLKESWDIVKPMFMGENSAKKRWGLAGLIGCETVGLASSVAIYYWSKAWFGALPTPTHLVEGLACTWVGIKAVDPLFTRLIAGYVTRKLDLDGQTSLKNKAEDAWLGDRNHLTVKTVFPSANAPQHIAEEPKTISDGILNLGRKVFATAARIPVFTWLLWQYDHTLALAAAGCAAVSAGLTYVAGKSLPQHDSDIKNSSGEYRKGLEQVNAHSREIAQIGCEPTEKKVLKERWDAYGRAWGKMARTQCWIDSVDVYKGMAAGAPYVLGGLRYVAHLIGPGGLMAGVAAFDQVNGSLNDVPEVYKGLVGVKAAINRLHVLHQEIGQAADIRKSGTRIVPSDTPDLRLEDVTVFHSNPKTGEPVWLIETPINLTLRPGDRLMNAARAGSGKTTLANLIAGIDGDTGTGIVHMPKESRRLYITQDAYVSAVRPGEFLNAPLCLNAPADARTIEEATETVGLTQALTVMNGFEKTGDVLLNDLSGGQRKKLVAAGALIQKPNILIADEVTAGLDDSAEHAVMSALVEAMPDAISIFNSHDRRMSKYCTHIGWIENKTLFVEDATDLSARERVWFLDRILEEKAATPPSPIALRQALLQAREGKQWPPAVPSGAESAQPAMPPVKQHGNELTEVCSRPYLVPASDRPHVA